ncbi:hypothetical protein H3Z83_11290 [Tenacibaculum sp. S7007]|uniref:Uncharacterized protein n=1 Tax=Tenacibaculum pelagium TaxID=2759527 RepID=A0A839ARZ0_9FLAO|nr:hypothetical protein [Tenacibaculum pelagium]MBA6157098.1 hypothetical protein [Tenacibaculum pelagium]
MFKKIGIKGLPVYVILYKNRVKIFRLDTGKYIEKIAQKPFSNNRVLFGDFQEGERLVKEIVSELVKGDNYLISPSLLMLLQQAEMKEGGLTEVEKRALIDSSRHMNAKEVYLYLGDEELTLKEAKSKIENKVAISY